MQYILVIIFLIIVYIIDIIIKTNQETTKEIKKDIDYNNYYKKDYIMTKTENEFYLKLKEITDKNNMSIFPQVDLERFINVNKNIDKKSYLPYRNRIKSRSIDFVIINNLDYKIKCTIELDDNSHLKPERIERDNFINELFKRLKLNLIRIKVSNNYNLEEIEQKIKECI